MKGPLFYLSVLCLLMACSRSPAVSDNRPFVVALDSAPSNLDPRFSTDAYSERIGHLLFNALIRIGPHDEILPDLAHRWEIQDRQATFYLKQNVRFHDGRRLTSDDVRYTYTSILDPVTASPFRALYEMIETIETPDPTTIRFILKQPHAPFLISLTRGILPRPTHTDPTGIGQAPTASTLTGSGPFVFVSYQSDDKLTLAPFPDYFEGASPMPLQFRIIPDESTRLLEVEKGNIDLVQNGFSPDLLPRLQRNPHLNVHSYPSTTYSYIGFNLLDPVLKNPNVRKAMAYALDKEKIIRSLLYNSVSPAESLLTTRHWAHTPTPPYPYDPQYASQLLDQDGWKKNAHGERFRLIYKTSQNEWGRRMAEVVQGYLAKIGIAVTIRSFEWGTFYADIKSGNFQIFSLSWVGANDPDIYYDLFHSQSAPPNGSNRVRYQNQRMDDLLTLGRITTQNQRKVIYKEVQEILSDTLPYVSLWHAKNIAVMKKNVRGYTPYENGDFYSLRQISRSRT